MHACFSLTTLSLLVWPVRISALLNYHSCVSPGRRHGSPGPGSAGRDWGTFGSLELESILVKTRRNYTKHAIWNTSDVKWHGAVHVFLVGWRNTKNLVWHQFWFRWCVLAIMFFSILVECPVLLVECPALLRVYSFINNFFIHKAKY